MAKARKTKKKGNESSRAGEYINTGKLRTGPSLPRVSRSEEGDD